MKKKYTILRKEKFKLMDKFLSVLYDNYRCKPIAWEDFISTWVLLIERKPDIKVSLETLESDLRGDGMIVFPNGIPQPQITKKGEDHITKGGYRQLECEMQLDSRYNCSSIKDSRISMWTLVIEIARLILEMMNYFK